MEIVDYGILLIAGTAMVTVECVLFDIQCFTQCIGLHLSHKELKSLCSSIGNTTYCGGSEKGTRIGMNHPRIAMDEFTYASCVDKKVAKGSGRVVLRWHNSCN